MCFTCTYDLKTAKPSFGTAHAPVFKQRKMFSMQMSKLLRSVISSASQVFTDIPTSSSNQSAFSRLLSGPNQSSSNEGFTRMLESTKVKPLRPLINEVRAFKSETEIACMRRAGQASGRAITETMRHTWSREKDLWSYLEYQIKSQGCDTSAYIPVIAGGKNALSIHYVRNDDILKPEEMVLIDAGGEYGGYVSDITRTYPVTMKFSPAQRDLYTALLTVQRKCVWQCREDAHVTLDGLHEFAEKEITHELSGIGFDMSGRAIETLFPHHLGHYLGLDVHDTPGYSRKTPLQIGHCITIEPLVEFTFPIAIAGRSTFEAWAFELRTVSQCSEILASTLRQKRLRR
ncbi:hypothetical protein MMC25_006832 [Agyrium rufum]|nr:hypothetical protein [Agyrium rufum]